MRKSSSSLREMLSENIKAFRKEHGVSQEELAEQCGLHRTYIGSIERHERNVTLSTLEVLSETLGVTVPELLTKRLWPPTGAYFVSISANEINKPRKSSRAVN